MSVGAKIGTGANDLLSLNFINWQWNLGYKTSPDSNRSAPCQQMEAYKR